MRRSLPLLLCFLLSLVALAAGAGDYNFGADACTIPVDTTINGDLTITGDVTIPTCSCDAVTNLDVSGTATVDGATALDGGLTMDTTAFTVADTSGNVATAGTLTVTGAATLNGGLVMDTDKFTVANTTGNTAIGGTLGVTGAATFSAAVSATSSLIIPSGADPGATCTVGQVYIDTDETVDTNCTTTADNSLCICTATNTWTALENN